MLMPLATGDSAHIGSHLIDLIVTMTDYAGVPPLVIPFTVVVDPCIITAFAPTVVGDQDYVVYDP